MPEEDGTRTALPVSELVQGMSAAVQATADAHHRFLAFSDQASRAFARTFELQNRLLQANLTQGGRPLAADGVAGFEDENRSSDPKPLPAPAFSREMCMEFAVGSVARVMGPAFAVVDT